MGINNGVITNTQISVSDVAKAIGASSSDVGTLCVHRNINIWSKYKPFKSAQIGFADFNAFSAAMKLAHWGLSFVRNPNAQGMANNGSYGSNFDSLLADAKNNVLPSIVYTKPSGGAESPYRLGDFMSYCHNAPCPIRPSIHNGNKILKGSSDNEFYYEPGVEITPENANTPYYYIKVSELYSENNQTEQFGDWYLGMFIYNPTAIKDYYLATMDKKFKEVASGYEDAIGFRVNVDNKSFSNDGSVWKIVPFFATQPMIGTLHNSATQSNNQSYSGSVFPLSFAMYEQNIRAYNENTDVPMIIKYLSAVMYTENATYNKYLYFSYTLRNNTSTASQSSKVELRITQKNSTVLNQNILVFSRTIIVGANSTYESIVDSKYQTGNQRLEVDLSKITGIDLGALIDAVKQNQVTCTLYWESANDYKTANVVNAQNDNPNNP